MKRFFMYGLIIAFISSLSWGQDEISKENVTELFKRIRRGAEGGQVFVAELPPGIAELGLNLQQGFSILGGFQESYGDSRFSEAYLDYQGEWQTVAQEIQQHFGAKGWTNISTAAASWGFDNGVPVLEYGDFCQGHTHFNYFFELQENQSSKLSFRLDQFSEDEDETFCEEEHESLEASEEIIDLPPLLLKAPEGASILIAENIPQSDPVAATEVMGTMLPGGWSSRSTLSTTLSPAKVAEHYEMQMQQAGWKKVQGGSTPLSEWSEWEFTAESAWLAELNVNHYEAFPELTMLTLQVLEKAE
jgi:hypothetical protein